MSQSMKSKVAVVTGGSSGIGMASSLAFARNGAKVVVADVIVKGGEETVRMIEEGGGQSIFIKADVSSAADVEALIEKAVQTYGGLDYAHNNAGVMGMDLSTADYTEEDWDRTIDINLKGVWLCMKYEISQMLKQGKGTIVNTASIGGLGAIPNAPAYLASKHGVLGLTKAAAVEYADKGIRVNAICPGVTDTPMIESRAGGKRVVTQPTGRMGRPEEIAEAVMWLCSDAASFVNGHGLVIDGGSSVLQPLPVLI